MVEVVRGSLVLSVGDIHEQLLFAGDEDIPQFGWTRLTLKKLRQEHTIYGREIYSLTSNMCTCTNNMGSYRVDSSCFMHGPDPSIKQYARSSTIMYFQNTDFNCKYYEKLDHIPSSCIVLTDASTLITEMESETNSRP